MSASKFLRKLLHLLLCIALSALIVATCAYVGSRLWPMDLPASAHPRVPAAILQDHRLVIPITSAGVPAAEIASFNDQLEAFLRFEYLRGRTARDGQDSSRLLLAGLDTAKGHSYKIFLVTDNDLLLAVPQLASLQSRNLIAHYEFETWSRTDFYYYQQQSHMFDVAYEMPPEQKLESLSSFKLLPALAQFLRFKSQTDTRIVGGGDPALRPLSREQATQLAADILDVAHFYDLPLDYFLGVGAMENDYLDVDGDLTHAVWKKRAQRGDLVLRRTRRRVMVSDYAIGTWQITRETLRAAHQLYLRDQRDYRKLPARLRPPRELDLNSVDDEVLTTYAGLLLRNLLDHFDGDVDKAMGAYNGGVRSPNPAYASSVKTVADYARRILEHASILDDPASAAQPSSCAASDAIPACAPGAAQASLSAAVPDSPPTKPPYRRADD
ncbi:MAG TPA: hypothetical protein VE263_20425 [Candidatus Angelobacter sp.]|nr:hypothetical protein [Candidatus Angelobacter sp.]